MDLSTPVNLLIAGIYFVFVGIICFLSAFGIFVLIRHGTDRIVALVVAIIFSALFLKILADSYITLSGLLS